MFGHIPAYIGIASLKRKKTLPQLLLSRTTQQFAKNNCNFYQPKSIKQRSTALHDSNPSCCM